MSLSRPIPGGTKQLLERYGQRTIAKKKGGQVTALFLSIVILFTTRSLCSLGNTEKNPLNFKTWLSTLLKLIFAGSQAGFASPSKVQNPGIVRGSNLMRADFRRLIKTRIWG
jgi:hypothetical protein